MLFDFLLHWELHIVFIVEDCSWGTGFSSRVTHLFKLVVLIFLNMLPSPSDMWSNASRSLTLVSVHASEHLHCPQKCCCFLQDHNCIVTQTPRAKVDSTPRGRSAGSFTYAPPPWLFPPRFSSHGWIISARVGILPLHLWPNCICRLWYEDLIVLPPCTCNMCL